MTDPVEEITAGLRRIVAPNPSPMTGAGTNTYLIGTDRVTVVDPGPALAAHLEAIVQATAGARIEQILVTHAHGDHSGLAAGLARRSGAPVLAFGPPEAGRSAVMERLARDGLAGGGEGVDAGFRPDRRLGDGARLSADGAVIEVLHTPGHFPGHLSFALGDILLSGDTVMGWASTLISPPEGDLAAFLATCARLHARGFARLLAGHGAPVDDPAGRIDWLVAHRRGRDAEIMATLADGPATAREIAARVYADLAPALLPAAARNVFAHLVAATLDGRLEARPVLAADATFAPARNRAAPLDAP